MRSRGHERLTVVPAIPISILLLFFLAGLAEEGSKGKVPDLVILQIPQRHPIQPLEFLDEVFIQPEQDFGPVDPTPPPGQLPSAF